MVGKNYPANWDELRREVKERHLNRCVNCRTVSRSLEIHHIVPVEQGGSHRTANLVPLCSPCHSAAHGKQLAPCVRWYTNGDLSNDEFDVHVTLWQRMRDHLGFPRYAPEKDCVYVPLADADKLIELVAV